MKLFRSEPVLVSTAVTAVLSWIAVFMVSHGVIPGVVATSTVQAIAPGVTAGVLLGLGVFIRQYVTPLVEKAEAGVEKYAPGMAPAVEKFNTAADAWGVPTAAGWNSAVQYYGAGVQTTATAMPLPGSVGAISATFASGAGPSDPTTILTSQISDSSDSPQVAAFPAASADGVLPLQAGAQA